jgi:deazaflavin-dependent oxidoreductase (nitroreductase family)
MTSNDDLFGAEHVRRYRETDGEVGHEWRGAEIILVTTTGNKSGEERTTPLIYRQVGDDFVIVASNGGFRLPGWFHNIERDPEVTVQHLGDVFQARARVVTGETRPGLWKTMNEKWPAYDEYQERAEWEIPVVVLERA